MDSQRDVLEDDIRVFDRRGSSHALNRVIIVMSENISLIRKCINKELHISADIVTQSPTRNLLVTKPLTIIFALS